MSPCAVSGLFAYPVKGFSGLELEQVQLSAGAWFPGDRVFAFEVGPSGFDPASPRHVSKMRFAVLARFPELSRIRLAAGPGGLRLEFPDGAVRPIGDDARSGEAAAAHIQAFLADPGLPQLRLLRAPEGFSFSDHHEGYVSVLSLEALRALELAEGRSLDPLRFRGNIWVDGAFGEAGIVPGAVLTAGDARLRVLSPIVRCRATDVDPPAGVRDIDMSAALRSAFGANAFGLYCRVETDGRVRRGDPVLWPA